MLNIFRSLFAPPRHLILILVAIWLGLTLSEKRVSRHGISKEALNNLVYYSLLGYMLGGRFLFVLEHLQVFIKSPLNIFSINIDLFDPVGALLTAMLVGFVYGQRQRLPLWSTLDALTPLFATLAIGLHLSQLAAGTAFGSPTNVPWGIELWNAIRHPTQIYELVASLLIFSFIWLRRTGSLAGSDFLWFTGLTAGSRLLLEAFRGDSTLLLGGIRMAQLIALVVLTAVFITTEILHAGRETD
ncbi:MAG: prolipoprotein diacylglyceryl transferase [Bacteroidota bacterium]|jgi:phosphatidylglycerol:prolipoprotein diacylglycerol transferase